VNPRKAAAQRSQAGFTLMEVLVSIVILVFGLIAVTNLLLVAGNSSSVANTGTTAAAIAAEQMEALKAMPFVAPVGGGPSLIATAGGDLDNNVPGFFRDATTDPRLRVPGGGTIVVRWLVVTPVQGQTQLAHITVRAEAATVFARRTRAEFTAFRSCTGPVPDQGACRQNATQDDRPCCPAAP
jgi:prepilin-type N-terminal cleavage/methylation domain-containing protein